MKKQTAKSWRQGRIDARQVDQEALRKAIEFEDAMAALLPKDLEFSTLRKQTGSRIPWDVYLDFELDFSHYSTSKWDPEEREAMVEGTGFDQRKRFAAWAQHIADRLKPCEAETVKNACMGHAPSCVHYEDKERDGVKITPIHPIWCSWKGYTLGGGGSSEWEWHWFHEMEEYMAHVTCSVKNFPYGSMATVNYDRKAQHGEFVVSNQEVGYYVDCKHNSVWGRGSSDALYSLTFYWDPDDLLGAPFQMLEQPHVRRFGR